MFTNYDFRFATNINNMILEKKILLLKGLTKKLSPFRLFHYDYSINP